MIVRKSLRCPNGTTRVAEIRESTKHTSVRVNDNGIQRRIVGKVLFGNTFVPLNSAHKALFRKTA